MSDDPPRGARDVSLVDVLVSEADAVEQRSQQHLARGGYRHRALFQPEIVRAVANQGAHHTCCAATARPASRSTAVSAGPLTDPGPVAGDLTGRHSEPMISNQTDVCLFFEQ
jgi:hypothetical protein